MKLPWKKDDTQADSGDSSVSTYTAGDESGTDVAPSTRGSKYTPGKSRPTPSRRQAENKRRGPVAPPPTNRAEARARRKEQRTSLSKDDKRKLKSAAEANPESQGLKPWRHVLQPHADVASGSFHASEFAADLYKVGWERVADVPGFRAALARALGAVLQGW